MQIKELHISWTFESEVLGEVIYFKDNHLSDDVSNKNFVPQCYVRQMSMLFVCLCLILNCVYLCTISPSLLKQREVGKRYQE